MNETLIAIGEVGGKTRLLLQGDNEKLLDAMIAAMIDDEQARKLIQDANRAYEIHLELTRMKMEFEN